MQTNTNKCKQVQTSANKCKLTKTNAKSINQSNKQTNKQTDKQRQTTKQIGQEKRTDQQPTITNQLSSLSPPVQQLFGPMKLFVDPRVTFSSCLWCF